MKLIEPSYKIESNTDYEYMLSTIEAAARTCYKSEDKIKDGSAEKLIRGCIKRGHESVLEHCSITVRIVCDRGVSHELVRHRLASYCISGETIIPSYNSKTSRSGKKWTIKKLYDYQKDKNKKGRLKLIRIRSVDSEGRIVPGIIKRIFYTGKKETFDVYTKSGRKISTTKDHKFLTPNGWKRLEDLSAGDRITANGIPVLENKEWLYEKYITENNTLKEMSALAGCCVTYITRALRKFGINKPRSMSKNRRPGHGHKGMFSNAEKKRISNRMAGENNPSWKGDKIKDNSGRLRAKKMYTPDICWGCGATKKLERHHVDKNPKNNEENNILFLCQKCHKAFHVGQGVMTVFSDRIEKIENPHIEDVYDIEMESDPHNFVANGIVVHNCQESQRYCAYRDDVEYIKPHWHAIGQERAMEHFARAIKTAESAYQQMLCLGVIPQDARAVLPNATKTEICMTCNLREWRHCFKLRTAKAAHPEMRRIMRPMLAEFKNRWPAFFEDILQEDED